MVPSLMSVRLCVLVLASILVGSGSAARACRATSSSKRTWEAPSKYSYTPPIRPPLDAPPAAAYDRIARLDAILSDYQPESELSRLSAKAGGPAVPVGPELFDVLAACKFYHEKTGGVLDPTIAPVGRLWRRAMRDRKLPDPEKLAEARERVGADKMILDPRRGPSS